MNILIVKLAALGDVLRTTSILRPLKMKFPAALISWLTSPGAKDLVETNPYVDHVYLLSRDIPQDLKNFSWDLIISLEEDEAACRVVSELQAKEIVGAYLGPKGPVYTPPSARWFDMGLLNVGPDGSVERANDLKKKNTKTYPQLLAEILGLSLSGYPEAFRPVLKLTDQDRLKAQEFAKSHGLSSSRLPLAINLGSGTRWLSKQPSVDTALEWVRALEARFKRPLLLLGGPDEIERNQMMVERSPVALLDPGNGHSLREFAAFIDLCELAVVADTLALHIASALGKKVIAVFGPTSAAEIELYGDGVKALPPEPCRCYYRPRCEQPNHCVDAIPTQAIVQAAEKLLGS